MTITTDDLMWEGSIEQFFHNREGAASNIVNLVYKD